MAPTSRGFAGAKTDVPVLLGYQPLTPKDIAAARAEMRSRMTKLPWSNDELALLEQLIRGGVDNCVYIHSRWFTHRTLKSVQSAATRFRPHPE